MTDTKPKDKRIRDKRKLPNQLNMNCRNCGVPLDETVIRAETIGMGYTELVTECPVCGEVYYD